MFVGPVVVEDGVDDLSGRDGGFDGVEEADELLVAVLLHAASEHHAVEHVEGGEQGGRSVALVVMRHRRALARLDRQAWLGLVERLDLDLLVDGQDHGMMGRAHVEADDVFDLGGESGVLGALERAQSVRLKAPLLPDALDRAQGDAGGLGDGATSPVGDLAGRLRTGQGQHLGHLRGGQRRPARRTGLVAKQSIDALLGVARLPAPDRGAADAGKSGHFQDAAALGRVQDDMCPLHMLERAGAVRGNRRKPRTILFPDDDADGLSHAPRLAQLKPLVNLTFVSVH